MGTWSTSIYADDEAQDAREAYLELLSRGLDGPAATDRFLKEWKGALKDSDDGPVIWFALADTQWSLGRLEDRVRDAAIQIIDAGTSLDLWREQSAKLAARRQQVLAALKKKLLSPQPPRKVLQAKKPGKITSWKPGQLFSYRLKSGQLVVLCLESIESNQHAELSALNWVGEQIPDDKTLRSLKRKPIARWKPATRWHVIGSRKKDIPYDRMVQLGVRIKPDKDKARSVGLMKSWGWLDQTLEQFFGWT